MKWRTSSHSNGQGGECVEVADGVPGVVPVRDAREWEGAIVLVSAAVRENGNLFYCDTAERKGVIELPILC